MTTATASSLELALERWLEKTSLSTFDKGETYYIAGRVKPVSSTPTNVVAEVIGTRVYRVEFFFHDRNFARYCSCPVGGDCKHLVAAALYFLDHPAHREDALSRDVTSWLETLDSHPKPEVKQGSIQYVINCDIEGILKVQITLRNRKKNGDLSQTLKWQVNFDNMTRWPPDKVKANFEAGDEEIWKELFLCKPDGLIPAALVEKIVQTGKCYWKDLKTPLHWGPPEKGLFVWDLIWGQQRKLTLSTQKLDLIPGRLLDGVLAIHAKEGSASLLDYGVPKETLVKIAKGPEVYENDSIEIEKKLVALFPDAIFDRIKRRSIPVSKPKIGLSISQVNDPWGSGWREISAQLEFTYPEGYTSNSVGRERIAEIRSGRELISLERDLETEKQAERVLLDRGWLQHGFRPEYRWKKSGDPQVMAVEIARDAERVYRPLGWEVEFSSDFPIQSSPLVDSWYVDAKEGETDWFDLEMGVLVEGKRVNLVPLLEKYSDLKELPDRIPVTTDTGKTVLVEGGKLKVLFDHLRSLMGEKQEGRIGVSKLDAGTLESLGEVVKWDMPPQLKKWLDGFSGISPTTPSPQLQCTLRPYQQAGVDWFHFLQQHSLGGILADDMGLGKTVQTISHLLLEKEAGSLKGRPALIVCPTSVLPNWEREISRFAPSLSTLTLHGPARKERFDRIPKHDVVLTTYPLLSRDGEALVKYTYQTVILDEAQNIKNTKTQAHKVLQTLKSKNRICLTGTPLENHLGELWSLFHFLMPGFLGSEKRFAQVFRKPIEKEGSNEQRKLLQKRIRPFLLRRTKESVTLDLPPKTEIITTLALTEKQVELYEAIRLAMQKKVMNFIDKEGLGRSRIIILEALLKLRQVCCDPRLLKEGKICDTAQSVKLTHLSSQLFPMIEEGRKILLFSQFTSMLDLIEPELKAAQIPYEILTGETRDRRGPIDRFQDGKTPLFLISLKAGGVGLNLTAADTVIHYDPWWNPAVETQATDRAHRIGQTRPVFVYKLISQGTVEEKILALQEKKRKLAHSLFDESPQSPFTLSEDDLRDLFAPL